MKKILFSLLAISWPLIMSAQWFGDGLTSGTAYYGIINASNPMSTWNISNYPGGVIYVGRSLSGQNDLEVGTGGILTIDQGITVKFCTTTSDLRITGTGILNASGIATNYVIFTKNLQSTWGHITFDDPAGTGISNISYCIIEYGLVTGTGYPGAGGGILIRHNYVTVSNSTIRNNSAGYGGGIFVDANKNPSITKCLIQNNTSQHAGGGIYCYNGSGSVIENCIFESNRCLEPSTVYYTGGGVAAQTACAIKVVNCTFVNNTSTQPEGQAILLHGSPNSRVINSIIWGPAAKQIYCYGNTSASVIINCAYRGITSSTGSPVNSIVLSALNLDPSGPNFVATDGTDWSIEFISPCRDAGVNSYTGVTIPALDYAGNSKIGTKDIGAYEMQYCLWTGNSDNDWENASNWANGVLPASGISDVIIPAGRPVYPYSSAYVIDAKQYLILEPSAQASFGTLDNSSTGTLWLKSSSYGATELIASLMLDSYEPGGNVNIELNLQGNNAMWHYISPPVASIPATLFSSNGAGISEYRENLISTDMNNGWVTSTGYHYDTSIPTPAWVYNAGFIWTDLYAGRAYNYYSAGNKSFTIHGTPNTGEFNISLAYNTQPTVPDHPTAQGWNLIGNPYTCGLDWDIVVAANSIWGEVEAAIYFRKNNLTYYYVDGSIVPNDYNNPGNYIAPMQGFFIKSNTPGISLIIPASAKTHTAAMRYKRSTSSSPSKGSSPAHVRMQFENTTMNDQIVLSFNDMATTGFDNLFDARKLFPSADKLSISSSLGGTDYAINSIPFPEVTTSVPLIIKTTAGGSYTIKATELTGLDSYNVVLEDKLQNESVNLSYAPSYSFDAPAGLSADRFVITISNVLTAIPETTTSSKPFNIYSSEEHINIQTLSDNWNGEKGRIKITDTTGRTISVSDQIEFSKGEIISLPVNLNSGIYVVEINSGVRRYVGKVAVR